MKTSLIITNIILSLFIVATAMRFTEHHKEICNLIYQDKVNKIEIKYLKGLLKFRAELKQEKLEEEVSIVRTRSIIP